MTSQFHTYSDETLCRYWNYVSVRELCWPTKHMTTTTTATATMMASIRTANTLNLVINCQETTKYVPVCCARTFSKPDPSMPQAQTQMHPKPPHSLAMAAILLFPLVAWKPKKLWFFFSFVRLPLGRRRFPLSNFFFTQLRYSEDIFGRRQ